MSGPPPFHVITGAPGAGKTTLIEALAARGLAIAPEGARRIIREGVSATGVDPRSDPAAFSAAMLAHDIAVYEAAHAMPAPVLFDRGIPDILGFDRAAGIPHHPDLLEAVRRCRYARVFLAPFWADIYVQDAERIQTPAEAHASAERIRQDYAAAGYRVIDLPLADVATRVAFIMDRL
jgi:predicted ATPase